LIYLDQAQITQTSVGLDGNWSVEIADIAPGLYTLRVDQLNAVGEVTARFETPFQRETLETLAAAAQALVAPEAIVAAAAHAESAPAESAATDTAPVTSIDPNNTVAAVIPKDADVAADASNTVGDVAPATPPPPVSVTVQPGFTLWRIAREQLGSGVMYVQVFAANKDNIRDPDLIYPGQVFIIPSKE
jgi:nucleoid-associated protein YgaU